MAIRRRISSDTALIRSVEIAYFRSFYKVVFQPTRRINVLFGENDTGKSNVMRALNIFFNGLVGDGYEFDFDIDLSTKRRSEAGGGGDVRKFVYVKVVFRTPAAHRDALGEEFYVKRTWSQTTGVDFRQEMSGHIDTPGKQQSLTKFPSKIKFKYIPAVKDRDVYEKFLIDTYNAISQADAFSSALAAFTEEIRNQTGDLSERLGKSLGMTSALAPPTDLADLFGSLDFETLIAGGSTMSLLRQRGDGVQARHIPELMAFAAEKDTRSFHIWGIEEPENSLSMNSAMSAAKRLRALASDPKVQVFITTHSPAFYSLDGADVAKFFLRRQGEEVAVLDGTSSDTLALMNFMGDDFYLPLVAEGLREAEQRAATLGASVAALERRIVEAQRPILFVEGPSEVVILEELARLAGMGDLFDLVSLDGTSHAERLSSITQPLLAKLLAGRRGFVLLDSDKAGRDALPKNVDRSAVSQRWIKSSNDIYWRTLPPTAEARAAFAAAGVQDVSGVGASLEDCFPAATKVRAMHARALALGQPRDFMRTRADLFAVGDALQHHDHQFYTRQIEQGTKVRFARWLVQNGHANCDTLARILAEMRALLS
ncbi:ATP-dependent nuclease [Phenylobacterium sp.]|uniref:ATP-dependent nuclease n=1 Tax=Phenylobacterium sp. TaxID=1871053 RepID=UPI003D26CB5A